MKKQIAILSIFLIFLSANVSAEISGTCGAYNSQTNSYDCNWSIDSNGKLTITGTAEMQNYKDGQTPWENYKNDIKEVDISGVTSVGRYAFTLCKNLTKVSIGDSVKILKEAAFQSLANLESIEFSPNSQLEKIEDAVFWKLPKLTNIQIPNGVSDIWEEAFGYTGITDLVLPYAMFGENAPGLKREALSESNITSLICPKEYEDVCKNYLQTAREYYRDEDNQLKLRQLSNNIDIKTYQKSGDQFFYDNKWYNSLGDIQSGNYMKKRIYTVGEANSVTGKKNSIKIRYK